MSSSLCLLLLSVCVLFTCFSAQRSCRARCGDTYSRSSECQCDYECLSHNECCKNYESVCTARGSCKGRCGEHFKRRRHCHCDIDCIKYNQCCPDYESQCATEDSSMEEEYGEFEVTTALDNTLTDVRFLGITDSSIMTPDKSPKGTQDNFEAEQLSPNNSVPIFHQASTMLTVNQQPSGRCATTTKPNDDTSASQQTDTNAETTAPITTEHKSTRAYNNPEISPSTAISTQIVTEQKRLSNNASLLIVSPEIASVRPSSTAASKSSTTFTLSTSEPEPTASSATAPANYTDLQPSNPVRSEDTQNQEHENQTESSNNTTSERPEIRTMFSTDKASIGTTTATQTENQDVKSILSTKDSLTYSASVKRTLASLTVSTSSTQVEEIPTKPMDDKTKLQDLQDYQADANSDTNLCRGRPVNGLTTIKNGTIVVFRGNYFWMLDSRRNSGPAHLITDYWGIPSPIDTVFTRCNCHGKTYIFKADKYWRFENDVMDADFPRHITEGFGLDGHVDAALSMPQYRSRRESVLFFKRGGVAQRYSYLNTPNCGSRSTAVIVRKRFRKETDPHLSQEIDTGKTWVGFPKTVTSAVSVRTTGGEGYKYYVFSQKNYYSLKMERDTPVILTPTAGRKKPKSAKSWFSCPETSKM